MKLTYSEGLVIILTPNCRTSLSFLSDHSHTCLAREGRHQSNFSLAWGELFYYLPHLIFFRLVVIKSGKNPLLHPSPVCLCHLSFLKSLTLALHWICCFACFSPSSDNLSGDSTAPNVVQSLVESLGRHKFDLKFTVSALHDSIVQQGERNCFQVTKLFLDL